MKKGILAIVIMGCTITLAMMLASCGGSSSDSAASASSAASAASASASSASAHSSAASAEDSPLGQAYESKAHEMESARNDYIESMKSDVKGLEKMPEALKSILDQDVEFMTRNINEIYESGVNRLEEIGGSDADVQAYKDKLAAVRDACLADIEKASNDLRS